MKTVLVSAVALVDADGRVLIAQRPEGKAMAGLWEFPGGKIEPGETPEVALVRELKEELGIETWVSCLAPLTFASHSYDDFLVYLPEMAGHCGAQRGAEIEMGLRQRAARLSNAGCGYTADSHLARLAIAACIPPGLRYTPSSSSSA